MRLVKAKQPSNINKRVLELLGTDKLESVRTEEADDYDKDYYLTN